VQLTLSDGINTPVSFTFHIIVSANTPPTFTPALADKTLTLGNSLTYALPAITDADSDSVSIISNNYPSFVSFSSNAYTINST
jgi:hypothetical protein